MGLFSISKASQMYILGLFCRTLSIAAPYESKLVLYKTMVRSVLLYASITWHPNRIKSDLQCLGSVQCRETKYILNDYILRAQWPGGLRC